MYAMRDRDNVQIPFVQRAGLQEIGNVFMLCLAEEKSLTRVRRKVSRKVSMLFD